MIGNLKLLKKQLSKLKHSFKINKIDYHNEAIKDFVNIIDIELKHIKVFDKISTKSNKYIENSFKTCLDILNKSKDKTIMINGPISKKSFLNKKYLGITEYLSKKLIQKMK